MPVSKMLFALLGLPIVVAMIPVAVIALDVPTLPPAMASMAPPAGEMHRGVPALMRFQARDGASLQYYAYPAKPDKVAVLVHGSVGPGSSMGALAEALQDAGVTTYVLDIRGHGGSGRRGDIDYIGQIDNDLADFVAQLGPANGGETRTLIGFSAGAGFTIRFAGGPHGLLFDRYVFLSPILPGSPTLRPNAGGWTNIAIPRIVTIASLDKLGIHAFDGFPVISYAVSPEASQSATASYSYRLMMNFGAGRLYEAYLKNIRRPATILVGDADEQVFADQFVPLLQRMAVNIPVTLVPNMKHRDMTHAPAALQAVVHAVFAQDGPARGS